MIAELNALGDRMRDGIRDSFMQMSLPGSVTGSGSLFRIHPDKSGGIDYRTMLPGPTEIDRGRQRAEALLEHGVMISTSGLGCLSTPMRTAEVDAFVDAFSTVLREEIDGG
jgi:glutamate-1-semialdehyde 2,1-aminomutase